MPTETCEVRFFNFGLVIIQDPSLFLYDGMHIENRLLDNSESPIETGEDSNDFRPKILELQLFRFSRGALR